MSAEEHYNTVIRPKFVDLAAKLDDEDLGDLVEIMEMLARFIAMLIHQRNVAAEDRE